MGNIQSKLDAALNVLCHVTNGNLGKSEEGYHLGPLRVTKRSVAIVYRNPFLNLECKIGKNDSGKWEAEASVGVGITKSVEVGLKAKMDQDFNVKVRPKASLNFKRKRFSAGFDSDLSKDKVSATVGVGPVSFEMDYQKSQENKHLLGGSFGLQLSDRYSLHANADTARQFSVGAGVGLGDVTNTHGVFKCMVDNKGKFRPTFNMKYVDKDDQAEFETENETNEQMKNSHQPESDTRPPRLSGNPPKTPHKTDNKINKSGTETGINKTKPETGINKSKTDTENSATIQDQSSAKPKEESRINADENAVPKQDVQKLNESVKRRAPQRMRCKLCGRFH